MRIDHAAIHEAFEQSYAKHLSEFRPKMGASAKYYKKLKRKFNDAVEGDVKDRFHLSWATIGFGVILTLLGGPIGFVVAVVACLFEYYLSRDLDTVS